MKTLNLNGENYTIGNPVISIGLNMKCEKVIEKCKILANSDGTLYVESCGIKIKIREEDLSDYFVDTKPNRFRLNRRINLKK